MRVRQHRSTDRIVDPEYRRRGIGHDFYELRKELVRWLGRCGIVAGSHIPGYADQRDTISADEYVQRVVAGELYDPTLSFQLGEGFEVRGALYHHLPKRSGTTFDRHHDWRDP